MHRPAAHVVDDPVAAIAMVRDHGFGHLVTAGAQGLDAAAVPVLIDENGSVVRAHVARANPIWRAAPCPALLIVMPDDAYISPNWYPSKANDPKVVPTWNYEVVHVHGTVRARHDRDWLSGLVRELTDREEAGFGRPWSVDDAPADYVERLLRGIVGLELEVASVEGKRKLSQNRDAVDVEGVISGLSTRGDGSRAVAEAMRRISPSDSTTG